MSDTNTNDEAAQPRKPVVHELKSLPWFFQDMAMGIKRFEIRKNDRDFHAGDTLWFREYAKDDEGDGGDYTGRTMSVRIMKLYGPDFPGLLEGYCAMVIG